MNPFAALIDIILSFYVNVVLLRFFLQYFRADFYNPVSLFVVKVTDPFIRPLRKIIPGVGGLDMSSLVLAWLITIAKILIVSLIAIGGFKLSLVQLLVLPVYDVFMGCLSLFMFLIFVRAILSWFPPSGHNPIISLLAQLTDPLLNFCRRWLPPMGSIDFTPMIVLLGLWFIGQLMSFYLYPLLQQLLV